MVRHRPQRTSSKPPAQQTPMTFRMKRPPGCWQKRSSISTGSTLTMPPDSDTSGTLSPVKRALQTVEKMQAKLEAAERARSEPIAIVGMGCRFPGGADNPELFWKLLSEGGDGISPAPAERWGADELIRLQSAGLGHIRWGGFLKQVDRFDPTFFGLS